MCLAANMRECKMTYRLAVWDVYSGASSLSCFDARMVHRYSTPSLTHVVPFEFGHSLNHLPDSLSIGTSSLHRNPADVGEQLARTLHHKVDYFAGISLQKTCLAEIFIIITTTSLCHHNDVPRHKTNRCPREDSGSQTTARTGIMSRKHRLPQATSRSFTRGISLYAQGKQVSPDHLFRYNTGRFIVNEEYELAKRFSPFNLDELCKIVSSVPSVASPIRRIEKKEGGYNKALLVTAENGRTVIAKVPCRNIVPKQYGTASEVAVLRFGTLNASPSLL